MLLTRSFIVILAINIVYSKGPCSDFEFLCLNGQCIPKKYICDGSTECSDGSDETHNLCKHTQCSDKLDFKSRIKFHAVSITTALNFQCDYGACIFRHFICDGIKNCPDGSDETEDLCRDVQCKSNEKKCSYGGCISETKLCDNRYNCGDCSDESADACRRYRRRCGNHEFACDTGACIRKIKKCNGRIDCLDDSDESEATCGPRPGLKIKRRLGRRRCTSTEITTQESRPVTMVTTVKPTIVTNDGNINNPLQTDDQIVSGQCSGVFNSESQVELFQCGEKSCDEITSEFPVGSVISVSCRGGESTALLCNEDGHWHPLAGVGQPIRTVCTTDSVDETITKVTDIGLITSVLPEDCGKGTSLTHPWLVGLFRQGQFVCSGTLIASDLVLTAGHCIVRSQAFGAHVIDADSLTIQHQANLINSEFKKVLRIFIHPQYLGGSSPRQDLALVKLTESIPGSSPVCLGDFAKLAGLRSVTYNRTEGTSRYQWDKFEQQLDPSCFNKISICSQHINIGENQFCAANQDSPLFLHPGSSGGPYVIVIKGPGNENRWSVAGIASNSDKSSFCPKPHSVFESVTDHRPWILDCGFRNKC